MGRSVVARHLRYEYPPMSSKTASMPSELTSYSAAGRVSLSLRLLTTAREIQIPLS